MREHCLMEHIEKVNPTREKTLCNILAVHPLLVDANMTLLKLNLLAARGSPPTRDMPSVSPKSCGEAMACGGAMADAANPRHGGAAACAYRMLWPPCGVAPRQALPWQSSSSAHSALQMVVRCATAPVSMAPQLHGAASHIDVYPAEQLDMQGKLPIHGQQ